MNAVLEDAEMREKDLEQKFAQNLLRFYEFAFKIFGCKAKAAYSSGNYYPNFESAASCTPL